MNTDITCKNCNGTGSYTTGPYTTGGTVYTHDCYCQDGVWPALQVTWLVQACLVTRGVRKGRLQRSRPKLAGHDNAMSRRCYFVWRLARFHAGFDVTMPMGADCDVRHDAYRSQLDQLAREVARRITGKSSAGVARWRGALFGEQAPEGLPASAYECGPEVLDDLRTAKGLFR